MAFSLWHALFGGPSPREVVGRLDNLSLIIIHLRKTMTKQLDDLAANVAANTTVVQSAITLLTGLKKALDEAIAAQAGGDNGAALQALSDQLAATDSALADAVAANTPAAAPVGQPPVADGGTAAPAA